VEILQPAKLVDDAKTDDSDSLLLAEHCKASSKAWEEEVEVGSGVYPPPTLLVVGEQSEEEEDGGEKLCPPNRSGHCFCVNRVDSKEQSCNLGNLLAGIVPADRIVELGDEEVEEQVDEVVAERGQAMDKVVESKRKDGKRSIGFVRLLF